ncbi:glycoside hydrolase superfamily [Kockovaella imperatae]|uniref:Beta-mannosidase A n=1 Tax=Kockovaella imperatae TaxID=4999 RepID=A0A1Y1UQ74_9TREE|nr:glycoside hydrolase superfamily [Kockovaella imperatae]ORX40210.1 glycoside hydrolase superfamily [Kockovaella imperatae]
MLSATLGLLALGIRCARAASNVIDLSGDGWTLTSPGNDSIHVPATVPSQNYMPLQAAGIVLDPTYGYQENEQAWVRYSNWTYTSPAITGLNMSSGIKTQLVFEGLDTYTTITFCDQFIGTTANQYRQFIFDVSSVVQGCSANDTRLSINFGPAQNITHEISDSSKFPSAGDANFADGCNDLPGNEFACKAWARKEQSDFGWDWSPHLIPAGPWRNISIVQLDQDAMYINNAAIDIFRQGQMNNLPPDQSQPWIFNASLDVVGPLAQGSGLQLDLSDASGNTIFSGALGNITSNNMTITGHTAIDDSKVDLWWPNGMGTQTLYTAKVTITSPSDSNSSDDDASSGNPGVHASVTKQVGFRTIILNLQPISDQDIALGIRPGSNWHFEINGETFYAKGANLVPIDVLWARVNSSTVQHLFEIAQDAHFNMFRVWSSGAYLDDSIYDLADQMGILLWSEFEFTDAEYPASPEWEAVYEAEAYYNVRRINHHPSLALWAGGNELESIQLAYFFNATNPGSITLDYQETFERNLIKCVYANTRSISYIPSSTYNGYLSLNFSSDRPQLPRYKNSSGPEYLYSDTDFYGDGLQAFNLSYLPVGRFADEFGFISMPGIESWDNTGPNITSFDDPIVVYHNRHSGAAFGQTATPEEQSILGIAQMTSAVDAFYPAPEISDARANFSAWIWSSEVFQADYYVTEIAFYRRGSGGPERQLGSLYWQFNDVWVAPTWSSVASNLKAKVMQYAVKDIYKPVIVRPYYNVDDDTLEVWVTSDQFTAVEGVVTYEWFTWAGDAVNISLNQAGSNMSAGTATSTSSSTSVTVTPSTSSIGGGSVASSSSASGMVSASLQRRANVSGTSVAAGSTSVVSSASIAVTSALVCATGNSSGITPGSMTATISASASGSPISNSTSSTNGTVSTVNVRVEPVNSTMVLNWSDVVKTLKTQANVSDAIMRLSVDAGNGMTHTSWYHPAYLVNSALQDPGLTLTQGSDGSFTVTATKAIAAWVTLDYSAHQVQGFWSENAFWLQKGESKTIQLNVWNDWTGDGSWKNGITVRSMWDNVVNQEYAATLSS